MKSADFVWSKEKLDGFLADPGATIPGTLMVSAGKLENPTDRQNLIEFLEKGDTSLDLCF
jgi:cytochrome c